MVCYGSSLSGKEEMMEVSLTWLQPYLAEHLKDINRDTDDVHSELCDNG